MPGWLHCKRQLSRLLMGSAAYTFLALSQYWEKNLDFNQNSLFEPNKKDVNKGFFISSHESQKCVWTGNGILTLIALPQRNKTQRGKEPKTCLMDPCRSPWLLTTLMQHAHAETPLEWNQWKSDSSWVWYQPAAFLSSPPPHVFWFDYSSFFYFPRIKKMIVWIA